MRTDLVKSGFSCLWWALVLLLLLAGIDQLLVRLPASLPAHVAVADFYRDLRSRVVDLLKEAPPAPGKAAETRPKPSFPARTKTPPGQAAPTVETVIEQRRRPPATLPPAAPASPEISSREEQAPRYVYADERGDIHFAETLAAIPEALRDKARALGE